VAGTKPSHKPTKDNREKVMRFVVLGLPEDRIAGHLGISKSTLRKHYEKELKDGKELLNGEVVGHLISRIREGDVTSTIFWLKTRAGWREAHRADPPEKPTEKPRDIRDDLSEAALRILNRIGGDGELDPPAS
jgi:transposase